MLMMVVRHNPRPLWPLVALSGLLPAGGLGLVLR
jgi:hypothetical protein